MDATGAGLETERKVDVREGVVEEGGVLDVLSGIKNDVNDVNDARNVNDVRDVRDANDED